MEALLCPVWKRPLSGTLRIVAEGVSVKCRACGGIHVVSRAELERRWQSDSSAAAPDMLDEAATQYTINT